MRLTQRQLRQLIIHEVRLINEAAATDVELPETDEQEDDLTELLTVARDLITIIKRLQKDKDFNYNNQHTRRVMGDLKKNIKSMSSLLNSYSNAL